MTDNPVFQNLCLNYWVLRLSWSHYWQQYGAKAFEGPEHKKIDMLRTGHLLGGVGTS